jgi:hypothetical protein
MGQAVLLLQHRSLTVTPPKRCQPRYEASCQRGSAAEQGDPHSSRSTSHTTATDDHDETIRSIFTHRSVRLSDYAKHTLIPPRYFYTNAEFPQLRVSQKWLEV